MRPVIVIVTGLSGSGKSVALRALEDEGFFCADNLPITLIESFVSIVTSHSHNTKIGIGVDIREKEFLPSFDSVMRTLSEKYTVEVIFLEAEKDVLIRRFKETRRPHPLASGDVSIEDAIDAESGMLFPLRKASDRIIDTSSYIPHQLRHMLSSLYKTSPSQSEMTINVISFGYKFGIPQNIDLLFDARFIPNPNFIPALKERKGTDREVRDYVLEKSSTREFLDRTEALLDFLIPQYREEGKAYLTIGFGCTGGKHRSPAIVEEIAKRIQHRQGIEPVIIHRDME